MGFMIMTSQYSQISEANLQQLRIIHVATATPLLIFSFDAASIRKREINSAQMFHFFGVGGHVGGADSGGEKRSTKIERESFMNIREIIGAEETIVAFAQGEFLRCFDERSFRFILRRDRFASLDDVLEEQSRVDDSFSLQIHSSDDASTFAVKRGQITT